jgi:hypothetical protein
MPAFVKTPKFILGTLLVLWVLYVVYANYQFDLIKFHLLPFVFVGTRLSSLILGSAIFGSIVTLLIQWLWRRPSEVVVTPISPPSPMSSPPPPPVPPAPTSPGSPTSRTVA